MVQGGARGWRGLEPSLCYLKEISNKSYFITLTTMAGPTGASKIALEGFMTGPKKTHNRKQAGSWGRKL